MGERRCYYHQKINDHLIRDDKATAVRWPKPRREVAAETAATWVRNLGASG